MTSVRSCSEWTRTTSIGISRLMSARADTVSVWYLQIPNAKFAAEPNRRVSAPRWLAMIAKVIFRLVSGLRNAVRFASYFFMKRKTPTAMPQHTTTPSSNSTPREVAMIAARQPKSETEEVAPDKPRPRRMLNEKQVLGIIPVSRTTLHRMVKADRFPRSTYISPNRKVWFEDEVVAWQSNVDAFNPNRGRGKGRRRRRASS